MNTDRQGSRRLRLPQSRNQETTKEAAMQTYTVDFRTDADTATRRFKARSPRDALNKALAFYDERPEELMFESYDGGHPVNEIVVCDDGR